MKRGFLRWFYLAVQFVMLAVSIPKVAVLFHAYDLQTMGPLIGDIDLRSWLVGVAVDLTATVTTSAAMAKFDETRKRSALIAPAVIILFCSGLSILANYEDAALIAPQQYASIQLFTEPALFINPILISAPPVLVLLLILLVPSVLAQRRPRSSAEIMAEAEEQQAIIEADARVKEVKARTNAHVRGVRLGGVVDNVGLLAKRAGLGKSAQESDADVRTLPNSDGAPLPLEARTSDANERAFPEAPSAHVSKKMWNTMPLKDRVLTSGVISAQEVAEVLGVSVTRARELVNEVRVPDEDKRAVRGRSGVPYMALVESLYARRTNEGLAQAQKLEKALGLRRRVRALQTVPDGDPPDADAV